MLRSIFTVSRGSLRRLATAPEREAPVKFSESKANTYDSLNTFFNDNYRKRPRFQRLITSVSTSLFLLYFCVFRKENDIDDWMYRPHRSVPLPYGKTYDEVLAEYEQNIIDTRLGIKKEKKE